MFTVVRKTKEGIKKISDNSKPIHEIVNLDDKISLNFVDAIDYHEKIKTAYNRIYYVYDGCMQLFINGQEILLQKGDACYVEKGMIVELQGTFGVIIASHPPIHL